MRTALVLVCLVLLAGCGGQTPAGTATPTTGATPTSTPTPTASQTPTATETPSSIQTSEPDNPWGVETISVGIDSSTVKQPIRSQVESALEYWEASSSMTPYRDIRFELVNDTSNANILIQVQDDLSQCGLKFNESTVGCTRLPGEDGFSDQVIVRMESGYTADSRLIILKHELGHTLGVDHGSTLEVMQGAIQLAKLPQTDAVNKSNPWDKATVNIYANYSGVPEPIRTHHRKQVSHAISYYQNGAEGSMPNNVSVETVESPQEADIIVEFADRMDVGGRDQLSNASVYGSNLDEDRRLERYTSAEIRLAYDVEGQYRITAYGLGYWIAVLLGSSDEELPPPFADDSITYQDEWWKRAN
ncbi:MAG: matrixin family metalloprotease [Halobacteriaceae archaeon]